MVRPQKTSKSPYTARGISKSPANVFSVGLIERPQKTPRGPYTVREKTPRGVRDSLLFGDFDTKVGRLQFVRDFSQNGKKLVENRRQRFSTF